MYVFVVGKAGDTVKGFVYRFFVGQEDYREKVFMYRFVVGKAGDTENGFTYRFDVRQAGDE